MKWLELMLAAMVANGFALLGAKVLAERGLSGEYQNQYLFAWYISGFVVALIYSARSLSKPHAREAAIGGGMATMSFLGQVCLVLALDAKAPGFLVFPIVTGASVLFVAIGGVVLFREKLGPLGIAGIICGLVSVVILSLP